MVKLSDECDWVGNAWNDSICLEARRKGFSRRKTKVLRIGGKGAFTGELVVTEST
jgi:hypothetical protein